MVSRNSAFALTVMLLVSSSAQSMSYLPSLPSLPSISLPSCASLQSNASDATWFTAKVAAAMIAAKLAYNVGCRLWNKGVNAVASYKFADKEAEAGKDAHQGLASASADLKASSEQRSTTTNAGKEQAFVAKYSFSSSSQKHAALREKVAAHNNAIESLKGTVQVHGDAIKKISQDAAFNGSYNALLEQIAADQATKRSSSSASASK